MLYFFQNKLLLWEEPNGFTGWQVWNKVLVNYFLELVNAVKKEIISFWTIIKLLQVLWIIFKEFYILVNHSVVEVPVV